MTLTLEGASNRADASVHHVRGRHHIGTRRCMAERLFDQGLAGDVVQHVACVINDAVLPMGGVGVECDIRDHANLGYRRFQFGHRALHQSIGLISSFSQQ